jgi:PRTRC genetic system protein A
VVIGCKEETMLNLVQYHIARPGMPLPPRQAALYEYILAGNGVFVRGARREFQAQFCIAHCAIRGLADLETSLQLNAPRVPHQIVAEMIRQARAARDAAGRPCEIVFHLELDAVGTWQCHVPSQSQSPVCVKPYDDSPSSSYARACIEVHSHVDMHASFSARDDQDEQGVRLYAVLGRLTAGPVIRVRVGIYGYHCDIPALWVFELPPGVGSLVR